MLSVQTEAFRQHCGDFWYQVNVNDLGKTDPISVVMNQMPSFKPSCVLEIGCSNGWRLKRIKEKYGCHVFGIDPSAKAIAAGGGQAEGLFVGTAENLPFKDAIFDTIIYGYCLAFVDPCHYFSMLAHGDRVLADQGHVFILDQLAARPVKRRYVNLGLENGDGHEVWCYEMDYPKLWLAHPHYLQVAEATDPDSFQAVAVLQKNIEGGFMRGAHSGERLYSYDKNGDLRLEKKNGSH